MRNKIICILLPLFLLGCSKKQSEAERRANIQPSSAIPFQITVVETTPEAEEINDIENQAINLLAAKDYDKLDALAKKLRDSKECYADGTWKVYFIYAAFELSDEASDAEYTNTLAALKDWMKAKPDSITARVAMADNLVCFAWKARGGGYANTVKDENWKLFFQRLHEAVDILDEAKSLKEQCPYLWSVKLQANLGLQVKKPEFDLDFDSAIKAWPDYAAYYYVSRAIYLLPRWYGAEGEWEKDLAKSTDLVGGEAGDMIYAQVVWNIHHYGGNIDVFDGDKISWERVDRGFAVILKQFPDSLAAKNERAHLAAMAGDREKARKYFAQTEGKVDLNEWYSKGEFIDAANWTYGQ